VNKACSWLYWNILSKKSWMGFSQDKSLCLLMLIYFSIWLLNVKIRSKCYGKSNVNKTNENLTCYQSRFPSEQSNHWK
jgi:hypothetical protein